MPAPVVDGGAEQPDAGFLAACQSACEAIVECAVADDFCPTVNEGTRQMVLDGCVQYCLQNPDFTFRLPDGADCTELLAFAVRESVAEFPKLCSGDLLAFSEFEDGLRACERLEGCFRTRGVCSGLAAEAPGVFARECRSFRGVALAALINAAATCEGAAEAVAITDLPFVWSCGNGLSPVVACTTRDGADGACVNSTLCAQAQPATECTGRNAVCCPSLCAVAQNRGVCVAAASCPESAAAAQCGGAAEVCCPRLTCHNQPVGGRPVRRVDVEAAPPAPAGGPLPVGTYHRVRLTVFTGVARETDQFFAQTQTWTGNVMTDSIVSVEDGQFVDRQRATFDITPVGNTLTGTVTCGDLTTFPFSDYTTVDDDAYILFGVLDGSRVAIEFVRDPIN